jgi:hypothetical protein
VGKLSLREGRQQLLLESAFALCKSASEQGLSSGGVERLLVRFPKALQRSKEREHVRSAFLEVFGATSCSFLAIDPDQLELGYCTTYQSIVQYLREDGLYHSKHRDLIEVLLRHLHQEVGRYENFKFHVRPQAVEGQNPAIRFCYTGAECDRSVEAYIEGYTEIRPHFVSGDEFQAEREQYIGLKDYERASRRFGGIWVRQDDLVRYLTRNQIAGLYLFFNGEMRPEEGRYLNWDELHARQGKSRVISKSARFSPTFLDSVLEALLADGFLVSSGDSFALYPGFADFEHVTFYCLGEFGKE